VVGVSFDLTEGDLAADPSWLEGECRDSANVGSGGGGGGIVAAVF
jgi:hypothetical protein